MNREQLICVLIGVLVFAGMFLCVPVSIHMMSLYFYLGDPNAGSNEIVVYRFLPAGWPRSINYGVLFWQCFFVCTMISCILFAFRRDIRKPTHAMTKWKKTLAFVPMCAAILFFLLWFVETSFGKVFWYFELGLLNAGGLGLLATFVIVNVYVDKKQSSRLLVTILMSCTVLALCMIASYSGHRYSPNEFEITPNILRLLGVLAFLGIWVCYVIDRFIRKNKARRFAFTKESDVYTPKKQNSGKSELQ